MYAAKRIPSWFPVKIVYVGLGSIMSESRMAATKRSASGSEAMTRGMSSTLARAIARSRAPFSSGLGKLTVGKSGLGRACGVHVRGQEDGSTVVNRLTCSSTKTILSNNPKSSTASFMAKSPTPCIGVYTNLNPGGGMGVTVSCLIAAK